MIQTTKNHRLKEILSHNKIHARWIINKCLFELIQNYCFILLGGRRMKKMIRFRWVLLAIWIITTIFFVLNQPNIGQIVSKQGEATLNDDAPSKVAAEMLKSMSPLSGESLILVFNDENKISEEGMKAISDGIDRLNSEKEELGIKSILDPFSTPAAKDQMMSGDETTLLVQVTFDQGTRDKSTVIEQFEEATKDISVKHYITGETAIGSDYINTVNDGVDKSGVITVVFILVVLILMFRSVVTPVVSLLAVGISYICSMGVIKILIDVFDFPVTSFTQMFVILVLFGIGTDYHILLLNRFKEELSYGHSVDDAIVTSLKTAGKTIIYSGLTVFIGFLSLTFVQFPVYRAANAVAIGIAVLLIEILTLTPVFMKVLGEKLFWPSKTATGHKESRFWSKMSSASVKHPILSLVIVAAVLVPVILFNTTRLSFDSMADMDKDTPSIQGFQIIADKFGNGKAMPVTLVIQSEDGMDNNLDLATIDNLTNTLKAIEGVSSVAGPTQPKGEPIEDLYTSNQIQTVSEGLLSANDGLSQVSDGLNTINESLTVPDFSKLTELTKGTSDLSDGLLAVSGGLSQVEEGISKGADGASQLVTGITQLKAGITSIHDGVTTISENVTKIQKGYSSLGQGYQTIATTIEQLKQLELGMEASIANIEAKLPNDPDVITLKTMVAKLAQALDGLSQGITTANTNYDTLTSGLGQINTALSKVIASTSSTSDLVLGIAKLEAGAKALASGLEKGSAGQQLIVANMTKLSDGAVQVKDGVKTLADNLNALGSGMGALKDGIGASQDGLDQITQGITQGSNFLAQLTATKSFYIPEEALASDDIKLMLDTYMSEDRTYAKLTINLDTEPYADESIQMMDDLTQVVEYNLAGTSLDTAKFGFSGATANSADMSDMATHDITFTQFIVLISIFVLLLLVIRSFWIPVYIIGSLIVAYYSALSATAFISGILFDNPNGLAWNVPFFSFVMIAALGVDYSIFLMERYRENPELPAKEAIVQAAKNVGGVVLSAAVILSGTFATLYPTNLVVLMELAICVIIGLMLLSVVLLPVVIPALITLQGKLTAKTKN
jgi:RND superfamily putative drug exporter